MFTRRTPFPLAAVTHPTGRITGRTQVGHPATEETSVYRRRLPLPDGSLNRTRLAAVAVAGVAVLSEFGQLGNTMRSPQYGRLAAYAIVLILVVLVGVYRRGRAGWWSVVALPVLAVAGGAGLWDPLGTTALAMAPVIAVSLYGSTWLWVARVLGALVTVPAAVAVSPLSGNRMMSWHSPVVLTILPQVLMMAVLTRGIYLSLLRQERAAAREKLLSQAGRAMLGVTDVDRIHDVASEAADALATLCPGVAHLVLLRRPDGLEVVGVAGIPPEWLGRTVDERLLTDPGVLTALLPEFREWQVETLGSDPATAVQFTAIGSRRRVPADAVDAFRNLSNQVVLAQDGCRSHAELDHRAHHDHLTRLPTRAKFQQAVGDAVAAGEPGVVALLNVDLDDFKQVNDGHGHAAGDELLVRMADRMADVAAGRGLAARFGGDEFAVLLTGLDDPAEAERIAELLCARLTAPVPLAAATVTVGASIGVAVAEPGVTVAELTRRADAAMYAAKAAGRNRVEAYPPARPQLLV
jgi:diguanylate cyclase (GGDEF)-like protein